MPDKEATSYDDIFDDAFRMSPHGVRCTFQCRCALVPQEYLGHFSVPDSLT